MGAKAGDRFKAKVRVRIVGNRGPIAQMLHPLWIERANVPAMGDILATVDRELSALATEVRIVVSGGGFVEITLEEAFSSKTWHSETTLGKLTELVRAEAQRLADFLKDSQRDYVIGVDVFDKTCLGGGQFAVVLRSGQVKVVAWKSYPVEDEYKWLAGFETPRGRQSPRVVTTALGQTMLLVCHDAQAYNHRNLALVGRADWPTPRKQVMVEMDSQMKQNRPPWVFNLIHQIEKAESIQVFRNSYKQMHEDYDHHPAAVGSFGYAKKAYALLEPLTRSAQFPDDTAGVIVILETA